jgi:hypothetical protein
MNNAPMLQGRLPLRASISWIAVSAFIVSAGLAVPTSVPATQPLELPLGDYGVAATPNTVQFSTDNQSVLIGGFTGTFEIFESATLKTTHRLSRAKPVTEHAGADQPSSPSSSVLLPPAATVISPDCLHYARWVAGFNVCLFDAQTGAPSTQIPDRNTRSTLAAHPGGEFEDRVNDIARIIGVDDNAQPGPDLQPERYAARTRRAIRLLQWMDKADVRTEAARISGSVQPSTTKPKVNP